MAKPYWQRQLSSGQDATQILLEILKQERFQTVVNSNVKDDDVWKEIADEMASMGAPIPRSDIEEAAVKCRNRWSFLQQKYIKYKLHEGWKKPPKYFQEVDQLMGSTVTLPGELIFLVGALLLNLFTVLTSLIGHPKKLGKRFFFLNHGT